MLLNDRQSDPLVEQMILVAADYCPFCRRCILALMEKGISFEILEVDLSEKTEFLELLSPYRRVPVLKHDDKSIYESSVINEYLEDLCPDPPLLPADSWRRAKARFWIDFCNTRFMPVYFNLLKASDETSRDKLRTDLLDHLAFMDEEGLSARKGEQPYWMGNDIGLVDIAFYPFFERFAAVEVYRGAEIPTGLESLHAWLATMRKHPSVQATAKPRAQVVEYFRPYYAD